MKIAHRQTAAPWGACILSVLALFTIVLMTLWSAGSAQANPLPGGNWQISCPPRDSSVSNGLLTSKCVDNQRNYVPAHLDIRDCKGNYVSNFNGTLYCKFLTNFEPGGSYIESCVNIAAPFNGLAFALPMVALCPDGRGQLVPSILVPTATPDPAVWGPGLAFQCGDISNSHGVLQCMPLPPPQSCGGAPCRVQSGNPGNAGGYPVGWQPSGDYSER
jgi:hypothetical protein